MNLKFTLEQIAHFDRCLFPEDFSIELENCGLSPLDNKCVIMVLIRNRMNGSKFGIIQLFQEFINDKTVTDVLELVIQKFVEENYKS